MSTITNLDIKEAYNKFNTIITERLKSVEYSIEGTYVKINYISSQLYHVGESFNLRNDLYKVVKDYIDNNTRPSLQYLEGVNFKNLSSEEWFISNNVIITRYFQSFVLEFINIYRLEELKNIYLKCNIDYQTYYRIINSYYNNVANALLKGIEYIMFGVGNLLVVSRRCKLSKGIKYKVDWGESFTTLKEYAKNNHNDLYTLYIEKKLNKRAFIIAMSPYCYDKDKNPNGFKWIVHMHKDQSAWLIFYKKKISTIYNIVPSNFVMNATRSQVDFTNNINSIDEIYDTNQLGFRDKLNCLLRYDINYINRFPNL